jgi:deazaflavin-dependent oxidoreductase (nitroreductase family)
MRIPNKRPGNSLGHRVVTRIASTALGIRIIRRVGPHIDPTLIRLTGGRLSSVTPFPALLLNHTGATTGVTHTTPVVYFTDAGHVVVIESNFGAPNNPAWYHNIKANPEVTLLGRGFRGSFLAEEVAGPERDRLFQLAAGRLARAANTPYQTAWTDPQGPRPAPFPDQLRLVTEWRHGAPSLPRVDPENSWAGQSAALATEEPAGQVVARMWRDACDMLAGGCC